MKTRSLLTRQVSILLVLCLSLPINNRLIAGAPLDIPLKVSTNTLDKNFSSQWNIKVSVLVSAYKARYLDQPFQSESWWGSIDKPPKTAIKEISLFINKSEIPFDESMYDYLGNPTNLSIQIEHGILNLRVFGGGGASGYTVQFQINHKRVLSRKIFLNEFEDDVCDKTIYVRNVDR